jgi:acrylyl-CoA reductase (NADPH)
MAGNTFPAFRIYSDKQGHRAGLEQLALTDLSPGEVVIEAHYSSVNYKDALAGTGRGRILRTSPLVGGVDVAGVVHSSEVSGLKPGDAVVVTGCGLSETRDGGYSGLVRVPAEAVVPLPEGLTPFDAMALGTAGFTAALAVQRLQDNHLVPELGPVLVTGATGGVGGFALAMLKKQGCETVALTGKPGLHDWLKQIGADELLDRRSLELGERPLEKAAWGGAVDTLGGEYLAWLTRTVRPWGSIASIGLAAGHELHTTVMPFILRGVSLVGINSVDCPRPLRLAIWQRLAGDLRITDFAPFVSGVIGMQDLPSTFERMLAGETHGRYVVELPGATGAP